ncbi:MAG: hypothetical protein JWM27_1178, partial [Gemmatimonadetes bacterium]|nr:hypothetical protein [Gemmatimonadota bacterium]
MHPGRMRWTPRGVTRALPLLAAGAVAACGAFQTVPVPAPVRLRYEVAQVLNTDGPTPDFYRGRTRLEAMGAGLDQILVELIDASDQDATVRANAEILLADRRSPVAEMVLRRVLLSSGNATVRTGAVMGLQRLAPESAGARNAIRAAIGDGSPEVRLNVLQSLDVDDAPLVRRLLEFEEDAQVSIIAKQLLGLLEARGAPLLRGRTGEYRTSGSDSTPHVVFHPATVDTASGVAMGALWAEVPGRTLVPLAQEVEAVGGVVPAFFDPRGERVVFEAERRIQIRDLRDGTTRVVGPGVAPRPIPFTDRFVFLREVPAARSTTAEGTRLTYDVLRVAFADGRVERLGQIHAVSQPQRFGNASPVRRVQVGEAAEGFVLRGEGIEAPFLLPDPFEGAARPPAPPALAPRPPCTAADLTARRA